MKNVTKWGIYEEVEGVLGKEAAVAALESVAAAGVSSLMTESGEISGAFIWNESPQGHGYWHLIEAGIDPNIGKSNSGA